MVSIAMQLVRAFILSAALFETSASGAAVPTAEITDDAYFVRSLPEILTHHGAEIPQISSGSSESALKTCLQILVPKHLLKAMLTSLQYGQSPPVYPARMFQNPL